jgi:hypothetical protein
VAALALLVEGAFVLVQRLIRNPGVVRMSPQGVATRAA